MAWRGLHVTVNEAFSGFPALQETMSEDTDRQSIAQLCDIFLEGFDLSDSQLDCSVGEGPKFNAYNAFVHVSARESVPLQQRYLLSQWRLVPMTSRVDDAFIPELASVIAEVECFSVWVLPSV
jgi:hypothetical protein